MRLDTGKWLGYRTIGMSFAQRRFLGFRCKYEYDAKAVLVYSEHQLLVVTYTLDSMGESTFPHLQENHCRRSSDAESNGPEEDGGLDAPTQLNQSA